MFIPMKPVILKEENYDHFFFRETIIIKKTMIIIIK